MRRNGLVLLAMVVVVASAALSRAEFTVYDDFNTGSVPDSVLWMPISAYTASVSGGSLVVDAVAAGGTVGARSKTTFGYGTFRFVLSSTVSGSTIFGVNDYSVSGGSYAQNAIYLRNDGGGAIFKAGVSQASVPAGWEPSGAPTTYTFVYHADLVEIYRDSTLLFQETDVNKIPQNASMRFEVMTYGTGVLGVDSVSYEPQPQPVFPTVNPVTYDDFGSGTEPDANRWMLVSGNTPSVSAGSLVANAVTAGGTVGARSKTTFGYGLFQFVVTSFTGGSVIFGINTYSTPGVNWAENSLYLRDDGGWALRKDSVDQTALPGGWQPTSLPVTYTFVYHADEVAIYRGVTLLFQETDTNKIPQDGAMRFEILTYGSGILGIDSVVYDDEQPRGTIISIQ